eukprot:gene10265-biopygen15519
MSRGGCSQ